MKLGGNRAMHSIALEMVRNSFHGFFSTLCENFHSRHENFRPSVRGYMLDDVTHPMCSGRNAQQGDEPGRFGFPKASNVVFSCRKWRRSSARNHLRCV